MLLYLKSALSNLSKRKVLFRTRTFQVWDQKYRAKLKTLNLELKISYSGLSRKKSIVINEISIFEFAKMQQFMQKNNSSLGQKVVYFDIFGLFFDILE